MSATKTAPEVNMIRTDTLAAELEISHEEAVVLTETMELMADPTTDKVDGMRVYAISETSADRMRNAVALRRAERRNPSRFTRTPYAHRDGRDAFGDEVR
jgi:hypothetical protein